MGRDHELAIQPIILQLLKNLNTYLYHFKGATQKQQEKEKQSVYSYFKNLNCWAG